MLFQPWWSSLNYPINMPMSLLLLRMSTGSCNICFCCFSSDKYERSSRSSYQHDRERSPERRRHQGDRNGTCSPMSDRRRHQGDKVSRIILSSAYYIRSIWTYHITLI